jgi:signal transduction histidine kinase
MEDSPVRVLLIDNDRRDSRLIREMLDRQDGSSFDLEFEDRLDSGLRRLEESAFQAVLLDLNLPDSLGLDTLEAVYSAASGVPIIVLSGPGDDPEVASNALMGGAQDYLAKEHLDGGSLYRSLTFAIGRKVAEEKLLQARARTATDEIIAGGAEDLTNMIEMAAHELRHPATIFKGYSTLLREYGDNLDPETVTDALDSIDEASNRLTHLINNLLDTSRIERKKLNLAYKDIDAYVVLVRAAEEMRVRETEVDFNIVVEGEGISSRLDPERVKDALSILLDNAVKFTPPGGEIDLWCEDRDDAVIFSVGDRGPGIPDRDRENVFGRFFRVEDEAHNSKLGIGLGLYIAKTYVLAHGGWITVSPRDGGGSVFSFGIPKQVIEGGYGGDYDETPLDRLLRRFEL